MNLISTAVRDIINAAALLLAATGISGIFYQLGFSEANIIMIYILSVLITAVITKRRIYSMISSVASVIIFNFLFTEPRFTLHAYDKDYTITFAVMFLVALITGTLTDQLKNNIKQKEEAEMVAQNEQLRANLLRSISHDLRTPLTSISGNASNLLYNSGEFDEETKKQLYSDIYDDSMWLVSLVENLLFITRFEDGRINLNISAELVDEVIAEALRHIDRRSTDYVITVENKEELLLARMDARLIIQVIINIVDNAVKYTPKGSEIHILAAREKDMVKVQISDNGPGIPQEARQHVFDMFYTVTGGTADGRRGLGLGLSLCKSIINAHGGEISVADNEPHGVVFTFTLPAGEVQLHE